MRIENYIPEGRENAISREALGNIVGDDRVARKMIEDARCNRGLRAARKWLKEHPDSQMKREV